MNRILLCILFSLSTTAALSQKVYFIYVQAESDQPFYVKVNDKLYTSSSAGYLILSNLRDTSYNLRIGFTQNRSEYSFTINVDHKDHGYLLKNFGENGWGLFDMQTLSVLYPVSTEAKTGTSMKDDGKRGSAFTEWLALAVDDPSIKEKPVYVVETSNKVDAVVDKSDASVAKSASAKMDSGLNKKVDSVLNKDAAKKTDVAKNETVNLETDAEQEAQKKPDVFQEKTGTSVVKSEPMRMDTVAVKDAGRKTDVFQQKTGAVTTKTEPVKGPSVVEKFKPSQVSKRAESSTIEGFGLVYVDQDGDGIDTIRLLIPNTRDAVADVKQPQNGTIEKKMQETTAGQTKQQESVITSAKQQPKEELKFLEFGDSSSMVKKQEPVPDKTQPSNAYITIETEKKKEASENVSKETNPSNTYITIEQAPDKKKCSSVAGENDFFVLRKRMASQKFEVDMLSQASKYFKTKCFTTYQLKNLSSLFLTDASKFRFFDASYAYVSDEVNFKTLESELKDDYYITRFQGMVKQKF